MRLIKPSCEIWQQPSGLEGIYKQIERVSRVCYKSENKITEDSAKPFVDRMIKSGHGAMLEHGTVYLQVPNSNDICLVLALNPYTKYKSMGDTCYATTNLRYTVPCSSIAPWPDLIILSTNGLAESSVILSSDL